MSFRRAAKVDLNQPQVVKELRERGFRVDIVSQVKKLYDLVVTGKVYGSQEVRTVRVELKSEGGTLTHDEADYHINEPYPETLIIAYSTEDILEWFHHSYLTKTISLDDADTSVSADAARLDTTHIMRSFTISKAKGKRSTRS